MFYRWSFSLFYHVNAQTFYYFALGICPLPGMVPATEFNTCYLINSTQQVVNSDVCMTVYPGAYLIAIETIEEHQFLEGNNLHFLNNQFFFCFFFTRKNVAFYLVCH